MPPEGIPHVTAELDYVRGDSAFLLYLDEAAALADSGIPGLIQTATEE